MQDSTGPQGPPVPRPHRRRPWHRVRHTAAPHAVRPRRFTDHHPLPPTLPGHPGRAAHRCGCAVPPLKECIRRGEEGSSGCRMSWPTTPGNLARDSNRRSEQAGGQQRGRGPAAPPAGGDAPCHAPAALDDAGARQYTHLRHIRACAAATRPPVRPRPGRPRGQVRPSRCRRAHRSRGRPPADPHRRRIIPKSPFRSLCMHSMSGTFGDVSFLRSVPAGAAPAPRPSRCRRQPGRGSRGGLLGRCTCRHGHAPGHSAHAVSVAQVRADGPGPRG